MSAVMLALLSVATLAAYVCRVDGLSWRAHPGPMATHAAGGIAAAWVLCEAAQGQTGAGLWLLLALSSGWILATLPRAMAERRGQATAPTSPPSPARSSAQP